MFCIKSKAEKALSKEERLKCLEKMLNEDFPTKLYIGSAFIHIFFALAAICFQIIAIVYQAKLYFIGTGIWVGVIMIICEIICLLLSIHSFNLNYYNKLN